MDRKRTCAPSTLRLLIPWLLLLGFCGPLMGEPQADSILNSSEPEQGVLAAGQPTAEQLAALAEAGFKTVVDLRTAEEDRGFDEAAEVARLGMTYHSIPVSGEFGGNQLTRLYEVFDRAERPLLLHCGSSNRVGALYYAYLVEREGVEPEVASQRATDAGLSSPVLRQRVEDLLEQRSTTTVILVRHAEKAAPDGDPPLSEAGHRRAAALATLLGDANVNAVYATQFARTRQTAEPLATALGLKVRVVHADGEFAPKMAAILSQQHPGETVLSVSHSNTVPAILAELGIADPAPIEDHQYDGLYVVTLDRDKPARLMVLRYGTSTP